MNLFLKFFSETNTYINKFILLLAVTKPIMSATVPETQSEHFDVTKLADDTMADADSEIYDEEECGTDNEEEVSHDMVKCAKCGVLTHYSVGECGNADCKTVFKMSKSGYLLSGEDGGFVCDEDEEIEYLNSDDDDEDEDIDDVDESDEDEDSSDSSDEDDMDMIVADEDDEYVYKKSDEIAAPDPSLRRVTRQSARNQSQ